MSELISINYGHKVTANVSRLYVCCEVRSSALSAKIDIITETKREFTTKLAIA